jgi:hypothetical protein
MPRTRLADNDGIHRVGIDLASGAKEKQNYDMNTCSTSTSWNLELRACPPVDSSPNRSQMARLILSYPANLAANISTAIPITIRYTAKGAKPRFRTQAMNQATLA